MGELRTDLRHFRSRSDGKNDSARGRSEGYISSGYWADGYPDRGKVDGNLWDAKFTYALHGHEISLGYQRSTGNSDFPWLNQGDGLDVGTITSSEITGFTSADERV